MGCDFGVKCYNFWITQYIFGAREANEAKLLPLFLYPKP